MKGEMMKRIALIGIIAILLAGCGNTSNDTQAQQAEIVPEQPKIDHYYSLKDGFEYGYEQAVSQNALQDGQAVESLLMFKYAGAKDGKYQVYTRDGATFEVLECNNPCEFMKIMVFFNGKHISTERMRATEGTIGWLVMADAINGKLEQFVGERNGNQHYVWFDEAKGPQRVPITE